MSTDMLTTIATFGVPALVALGTTWLAQRGSFRTKQVEAEASPYGALADRVVTLESKVQTLEASQVDDRHWITRTILRVVTQDHRMIGLLLPWPVWYVHDEYRMPSDLSATSPQNDQTTTATISTSPMPVA